MDIIYLHDNRMMKCQIHNNNYKNNRKIVFWFTNIKFNGF